MHRSPLSNTATPPVATPEVNRIVWNHHKNCVPSYIAATYLPCAFSSWTPSKRFLNSFAMPLPICMSPLTQCAREALAGQSNKSPHTSENVSLIFPPSERALFVDDVIRDECAGARAVCTAESSVWREPLRELFSGPDCTLGGRLAAIDPERLRILSTLSGEVLEESPELELELEGRS